MPGGTFLTHEFVDLQLRVSSGAETARVGRAQEAHYTQPGITSETITRCKCKCNFRLSNSKELKGACNATGPRVMYIVMLGQRKPLRTNLLVEVPDDVVRGADAYLLH